MRRLALTLLATSAVQVAFGPVEASAQPGPPQVYIWTGAYVGVNAGYRWVDDLLTANGFSFLRVGHSNPFNIPGRFETFNLNGGLLGLQGGYSYQFLPNWLVGIEADVSWGKRSDSHAFLANDGMVTLARTSTLTLGLQTSIRGRFGIVSGPFMLYGTAGIAFVDATWTDSWPPVALVGPPRAPSVSIDKTLVGWTAGFGAEYLLALRWLLRFEYLHADYGSFSVPLGLTFNGGNVSVTTDVVRIAVSYKFLP
jgi:opacity protein-like surface antigen